MSVVWVLMENLPVLNGEPMMKLNKHTYAKAPRKDRACTPAETAVSATASEWVRVEEKQRAGKVMETNGWQSGPVLV